MASFKDCIISNESRSQLTGLYFSIAFEQKFKDIITNDKLNIEKIRILNEGSNTNTGIKEEEEIRVRDKIIEQLLKPVLRLAKKIDLSPNKFKLLAHPRLTDHPEVQKNLIQPIAPLSLDQTKIKVAQKIRDIETGYIVKEGDSYVYSGKDASEREIVKSENADTILELPPAIELDVIGACNKIMFLLTGRTLTKGESRYTKEIIEKNKERTFKIVKSCNGDLRELNALYDPLVLARNVINNTHELLSLEMDVAQRKKEMMKE